MDIKIISFVEDYPRLCQSLHRLGDAIQANMFSCCKSMGHLNCYRNQSARPICPKKYHELLIPAAQVIFLQKKSIWMTSECRCRLKCLNKDRQTSRQTINGDVLSPASFNTKTRLFKYTEKNTTKKWKFSDKKTDIFSYFCSKHRLWVLVRTASSRRF